MWYTITIGLPAVSRWTTTILPVCLLAFASSGSGCGVAAPDTARPEPSPLEGVDRFAVYFAGPFRSALGCYDMAIVDPDAHGRDEVGRLRGSGTLTIAYLNVGEIETYRWFYPRVDQSWILGANPNWENHYYVDARAEGWQSLLLEEVIPRIVEKGYEGLFLDMVDTALPGLFPETEPGMIELLHRIGEEHPDLVLIMNHGFFLAEAVAEAIDGVVVEGVFTRYDFDRNSYRRTPPGEQESRLRRIRALEHSWGFESFLINYAGEEDEDLRAYARHRAAETGLRSFLSTIDLDTVSRPEGTPSPGSCLDAAEATAGPATDLVPAPDRSIRSLAPTRDIT